MAETKISWADYTFNPWWGCQRVSPACEHCYAESFAVRMRMKLWGPSADRRYFGDKHWDEPRKWARLARKGTGGKVVFCASMADWSEDRRGLNVHRERLFRLIEDTPELTWLCLTKRPDVALRLVPERWKGHGCAPENFVLGFTAEDQEWLEKRAGHAMLFQRETKCRTFLSYEPALGPLDLEPYLWGLVGDSAGYFDRGMPKRLSGGAGQMITARPLDFLHLVIVGGESGGSARPFNVEWAEAVRKQCAAAKVPYHFKQLGGHPVIDGRAYRLHLDRRAGAEQAEWPASHAETFAHDAVAW